MFVNSQLARARAGYLAGDDRRPDNVVDVSTVLDPQLRILRENQCTGNRTGNQHHGGREEKSSPLHVILP